MRTRDESGLLLLVVVGAVVLGGGLQGARKRPRVNFSNVNPVTGKPIVRAGTQKLSRAELQVLAVRHGIVDVKTAVDIAMRESGGYVDVVVDTREMKPDQLEAYWGAKAQPEYSVGLWQINVLANAPDMNPEVAIEYFKDPDANADMMAKQGGRTRTR